MNKSVVELVKGGFGVVKQHPEVIFLTQLVVAILSFLLVNTNLGILVTLAATLFMPFVYIELNESLKNNEKAQLARVKDRFNSKTFEAIVWTFVMVFLWSLLFVIPGIIKAFEYHRAFYIAYREKDNPDISGFDCLKLSKEEMNGSKGKLFLASLLASLPTVILSIVILVCSVYLLMHTMPYMDYIPMDGISMTDISSKLMLAQSIIAALSIPSAVVSLLCGVLQMGTFVYFNKDFE